MLYRRLIMNERYDLGFSVFQQNRVLIRISNNGPLIPPEIQNRIFVPFFTTKKHGSGIGLSICQEIMKLHKGSLAVISTQTKFNLIHILNSSNTATYQTNKLFINHFPAKRCQCQSRKLKVLFGKGDADYCYSQQNTKEHMGKKNPETSHK